jgi:light-regulated signal transduction histidine kinase (bacteriophytochrome)
MNSGAAKEWGARVMISCFPAADNGPCMGGKYYKKIFHIFQRLRPRDKVESTGVGLAIVTKVVKMRGEAIMGR